MSTLSQDATKSLHIPFKPEWVGLTGLLTEYWPNSTSEYASFDRLVGCYDGYMSTPKRELFFLKFEIDLRKRCIRQELPGNYVAFISPTLAEIYPREREATERPMVVYKLGMDVSVSDYQQSQWILANYSKIHYPIEQGITGHYLAPRARNALREMAENVSIMVHAMEVTCRYMTAAAPININRPIQLAAFDRARESINHASRVVRASRHRSGGNDLKDPNVTASVATIPLNLMHLYLDAWYYFQNSKLPQQPFDRYTINEAHHLAGQIARHFLPPSTDFIKTVDHPGDTLSESLLDTYASDIANLTLMVDNFQREFVPYAERLFGGA